MDVGACKRGCFGMLQQARWTRRYGIKRIASAALLMATSCPGDIPTFVVPAAQYSPKSNRHPEAIVVQLLFFCV